MPQENETYSKETQTTESHVKSNENSEDESSSLYGFTIQSITENQTFKTNENEQEEEEEKENLAENKSKSHEAGLLYHFF